MMRLFLSVFLALVVASAAQDWRNNPLVRGKFNLIRKLSGLVARIEDATCRVNLCFVLQGDRSISNSDFINQKNFVDLMVAILTTDQKSNFCAVQYGAKHRPISKLTDRKIRFLNKVLRVRQLGGGGRNIAAAIRYASRQLDDEPKDVNKIIVLGDGISDIGFRAAQFADRVNDGIANICAVGVGDFSIPVLAQLTDGDTNRVFTINGFFDLGEVVTGLINDVCGL